MHLSRSILVAGILTLSASAQQTRPAIQTPPPQATSAPASTAGAPSAVSAGAGLVSPDTYIITPGDVLQLNVWKEPNLSVAGIPVRPDGQISLSLLGDIPAAGMTPMGLGKDIAERLKKYMTDPLVTVTVSAVAAKEIYFIGEVGKIGPLALTPGLTPLQAIAAAGGLTPYAKKKLYILRKGPKGELKIPFDYKKALKSGDQQGVVLQPGDTIVVP